MKSRYSVLFLAATLLVCGCSDESDLIINPGNVPVDNPDEMDTPPDPCEGDDCDCEGDDCQVCEGDDCGCEGEECGELPPVECQGEDDCPTIPETCDVCAADARKCDGVNLLVCQKNDKGCLTWQVQENCGDKGMWCEGTSLSCVGCSEACDVGMRKCGDTGIVECSSDAHGCAVWTEVKQCSDDEHCDDVTLNCVSGCTSVCTEGEFRCGHNAIETCALSASGCMSWTVSETCESGKTCVGDTPKCDYECGDDCEPFTIMVLPDPQNYNASSNGIYKKQMQWIADNKEKENIRFVLHLGDMTDNNSKSHYERAIAAHDILAAAGIPCAPSTGNHDYREGGTGIGFYCRDRSQFSKYFNDAYFQTKYADSSWFHGYKLGANMYATFNVGSMKFAVIALEFFPRKDAMCWAENLLSNELKDHYVILTTHGYLNPGATEMGFDTKSYSTGSYGDISSGARGIFLYKELVARYSNIIMVVSGHESGAEHRTMKNYVGGTVYEMLVDYQSEMPSSSCGTVADAGNGWMRMLKINPMNEKNADGSLKDNVEASTVSALDEFQKAQTMFCSSKYDSKITKSDHRFSFALDFASPREFKYSNNDNISFVARTINTPENDATDGEQYVPSVAVVRSTGAFVAAWEDDADKDGKHRVMARGFCAGGCEEAAPFDVSTTSGVQSRPDVAVDKNGNFVVVWEELANGDKDIYMRGFDARGKERIAQTKVNSDSKGAQELPAIAMNDEGSFVVVWQDSSVSESKPQVYMRGFKADGTESFGDRNVIDSQSGPRRKPDVGMASDGTFVVTWEDDTEAKGVYQIIAKGFHADGSDRLQVFTVNTKPAGQQLNPSIGMNESGTFYIAFEDDSDGNGKYQIMARGFDKDGKEIQKDMTLSASDEKAADPVVCVSETGKAVFGWTAAALHDGDIQKRLLSSPGKLKDEGSVNRTDGVQKMPAVGCTADGRYVFLFADDNRGRGTMDILGQGYNE